MNKLHIRVAAEAGLWQVTYDCSGIERHRLQLSNFEGKGKSVYRNIGDRNPPAPEEMSSEDFIRLVCTVGGCI